MLEVVFEYNGSDIAVLPHARLREESELLKVAQRLAAEQDVDISEITLRFAPKLDAERAADRDNPSSSRVR